jgi:hypothetical protein
VPGRKTDVKDCEWISDLARHGLIARSQPRLGRTGEFGPHMAGHLSRHVDKIR